MRKKLPKIKIFKDSKVIAAEWTEKLDVFSQFPMGKAVTLVLKKVWKEEFGRAQYHIFYKIPTWAGRDRGIAFVGRRGGIADFWFIDHNSVAEKCSSPTTSPR